MSLARDLSSCSLIGPCCVMIQTTKVEPNKSWVHYLVSRLSIGRSSSARPIDSYWLIVIAEFGSDLACTSLPRLAETDLPYENNNLSRYWLLKSLDLPQGQTFTARENSKRVLSISSQVSVLDIVFLVIYKFSINVWEINWKMLVLVLSQILLHLFLAYLIYIF